MRVIIHRGIDQIGGCITEIATDNTRIFIDLGRNLPDGKGCVEDIYSDEEKVRELTRNVDAIFYTHYHGDHLGHFAFVPDTVEQYIGGTARKVALCKTNKLKHIKSQEAVFGKEIEQLNKMIPFIAGQEISIKGKIKVTPYWVSHSAYDSYMFLIEAEGKRILHTGDFRDHGYIGRKLYDMIDKYILRKGQVDLLITEGTMLSRLKEPVKREKELEIEIGRLMRKYKYVFAMCSSTDLERLSAFHNASKLPLLCDDYQKEVLEIFADSAGKYSDAFTFRRAKEFDSSVYGIDKMKEQGFCMLIRATSKFEGYLNTFQSQLNRSQTLLIYSMWKEYANPKSRHAKKEHLSLIDQFENVEKIHTSGHASAECLANVCKLVNPVSGIIPIHSEYSENFKQLDIGDELKNKIITSSQILSGIIVII